MNLFTILLPSDTNTMTYFTVGNASSQMDPGSQGFLPTVVCPSPEDATFNPYKFGTTRALSLGFL
jgi:hypothetical protein